MPCLLDWQCLYRPPLEVQSLYIFWPFTSFSLPFGYHSPLTSAEIPWEMTRVLMTSANKAAVFYHRAPAMAQQSAYINKRLYVMQRLQ